MILIIPSLFTIIVMTQHPDVTTAARLVFHTNEPVIHMVLTKQLQLRCSVSTTDTMTANSNTAVSEISDIAHVISIIITKVSNVTGQAEPVASISPFEPASLDVSETQNMHVEGNLTETAGLRELGYLQVTWNGPTGAQAGNYTCEITGLTSNKHSIDLKGSLNITASEPGVSDLIKFIIDHDRIINQLQIANQDLVNKTEELRANLTASNQLLQDTIVNDVTSLRSNMTSYGSQLNWVTARLNSTLLESGLIGCSNYTNVAFSRSYSQPPNVLVSIANAMFDSHSSLDYGFEVYVINVTLHGFTAYCKQTGPGVQSNFAWLAATSQTDEFN